MDFYQDLLSGKTTLHDVSDEELEVLIVGWTDKDNYLCPTGEIWGESREERKRRKVERVRAGLDG